MIRAAAIEYATTSAEADGHTNDVRHLLEAWPAR